MDTVRNYITRFAQWILRDELEAARNYLKLTKEARYLNWRLACELQESRTSDKRRIQELRDWLRDAAVDDDTYRLIRFTIDYADWGEEIRNNNTYCVHPARRWGIDGFAP